MIDQPRGPIPDRFGESFSDDIPDPTSRVLHASELSPTAGRVDIVAMVRSLQRRAGVTDCFRRGHLDCDDIDCDWRSFCRVALPNTGDRPAGRPTPKP